MKNIVIIGAGDLGKELVWLIEDINRVRPTYLILGFLDDDLSKTTYSFNGYRVLGGTEKLGEINAPFSAVLAIRDGSSRKRIVEEHRDFDSWETVIHPTAVIASSSRIGKGCVFFPQVTVSVDAYLGNFGLYYIHSTICNDCWIGEYCSFMANTTVSEHAEVKSRSVVEAGMCIPPFSKKEKDGVRE